MYDPFREHLTYNRALILLGVVALYKVKELLKAPAPTVSEEALIIKYF